MIHRDRSRPINNQTSRHRAPPDGLSKAKASVKRADWNWCCYRSFRLHVSRNDRYQERLKRAEAAREDFLREYPHRERSETRAGRNVKPENVIASLWWLERRYPNQFALRNVYRSEGSTDQPIGDKIDENQLRRYSEWKISEKRMKRKRLRNLSRFPRLKVASLTSLRSLKGEGLFRFR